MKILIVEDDGNLRSGLKDLLELENFVVMTASDIDAGFKLYRANTPDFCIFDVMLKTVNDGFALCKKIRDTDIETPILMLSARTEEIDRVLGLECGADDYLTKPFGPRELVARINAISRRTIRKGPHEQVTKPLDFTMNGIKVAPNSLRAYSGSSVIELTKRDIAILKLLFDKAGQAVDRDELFDTCWGRDFMSNSRSLDQYISTLRKKLENGLQATNIINTVHGIGYRYDPKP